MPEPEVLKAGRELDRLIAERVMGLNYVVPPYSTEIAVAMEVIEKLKDNDFWWSASWKSGMMDVHEVPAYEVRFRCVSGSTRGDHIAHGRNLALAICLAALKAVGEPASVC